MSEENKTLLRRFHQEVLNERKLEVIDQLCAPDIVDHSAPPGSPPGMDWARQMISMLFAAFPDMKLTTEDLVAEGDKVVARYTMKGTHRGEFMGVAPTGKQISVSGMEILRFARGKVMEHWGNIDTLGLMQQLGVIPPSG
ncbi:MAG TPA: ester cyclase [Dehalococcoidia bacterium]|nr:ester cyclase [Dehalococcoidia bacterium]